MTAKAEKAALRKELRAARKSFVEALEPFDRDGAFLTFPRLLHPLIARAAIVAPYWPGRYEAPTAALIDFLGDSRRQTALPWFSTREAPMQFRSWNRGDPIHPGPFGIGQPDHRAPELAPELLIVPLVGFDNDLYRLGQGGGHYDRWLADHPDTMTIGLGWSVQQVSHLPREDHDRPLDAVVTEREALVRSQFVEGAVS